jgi:sigma-B regulation protein RsbU (phosphoserine phosphatase)
MADPIRILVCAADAAGLQEIRWKFESRGCAVTGHILGSPDPADLGGYRLVVIDAGEPSAPAFDLCRRLRSRIEDTILPVLFVLAESSPRTRLACFAAGADAYLPRPFIDEELQAQALALLRTKEIHARLSEKTAEIHRINKRLQAAYQQIDQELELAQRIQASFLPQTMPQVPHVRFAVHYLLCGRVGGDFYDIFRLDERHVGFYVADAMGHGVAASLLTIFVKKGVRTKEVNGSQYRLLPPDEVLTRLNRDLIDQQLSEQPFITMVYGLFNHIDGTLQFSRAGHPYPLHVPREGEPRLWQQEGLLLGVHDAKYPRGSHHLAMGDKLLFYTDGVDNARFEDNAPGVDSLVACAGRHRELPVQEFIARLTRDLFGTGPQEDDLTLLALERSE